MHNILGNLPFLFCYMDDILIPSADEQEHWEHLSALFDRLEKHGLIMNADKFFFGV